MPTQIKDPSARLDYSFDWSTWLGADTISVSQWIVPDGLVADVESDTDTTTTIWLEGGTVGASYLCVNRITTAAGRIEDRTLQILVRER